MRTRLLMIVAVASLAARVAVADDAAEQSPAPSVVTAPAGKSEAIPEVTVTARRAELAPRVSKFVDQIVAQENGGEGGLARWQAPVCPLELGLPQEEGEFLVARLAEIVQKAGVALSHPHCRPNLFILVSADPRGLLQGWESSNGTRMEIFAGATPLDVDEFIATPGVVKTWYSTGMTSAWGVTPSGGFSPSEPPVLQQTPMEATHISRNVIYTFSRVFVIADQKRLQGVTRGQFADYVAMVSLSRLKPGPSLGDAPTILKLFDGAPQAAPAGMTDWDRAFLKSLYSTEQKSKLQRSQIAREMVREIVPR
jgi:hypothetical protein